MLTFRKIEHKFILKDKKSSKEIKGIILTVQEINLKRKVLGVNTYDIMDEFVVFKPELDVLARHITEDVTFPGLARIWLKINESFDNFYAFQHRLLVTEVIEPDSSNKELFFLFNHFANKNQ